MTPNDAEQLKAALLQGPVSVGIDASSSTFNYYSGGTIIEGDCGTNIDHGVLAVGFGSTEDYYGEEVDYFIVKNSWGTGWGQEGYVFIGTDNVCGILTLPSIPTW